MQGFTNLRSLKSELAEIPSREPEAVIAWAREHPESAWGKHLIRHSERVLVEYVRRLIEVVVIIDQPAPKRIEVPVRPLPPPRESKLHRRVTAVPEIKRKAQLAAFFKAFAPLRLAYANVPELQNLFAEAERIRKEFGIF